MTRTRFPRPPAHRSPARFAALSTALFTASIAALLAMASPPAQAQSAGTAAPRKPRRLRPGDVVGVVDPASATWDPVDVDIVVESLAALGLKARLGAHLLDRHGYLAGRDEDRAADCGAAEVDVLHHRKPLFPSRALLPARARWYRAEPGPVQHRRDLGERGRR